MQTFKVDVTASAWVAVATAVTGALTVVNQTNGKMLMAIAASAPNDDISAFTDYVRLEEPWSIGGLAGENIYVRMDNGEKDGQARGIRP